MSFFRTEYHSLASSSPVNLIFLFALPAITANLVDATYNIADQIYIGHGVGLLGNAATSVAFPLTTICTALSLLIGVGAASNFNLQQGMGNKERAVNIAGNGLSLAIVLGLLLAVMIRIFLAPMLLAFGATGNVMPLAETYAGITTLGIPLLIFRGVSSHLIRSDGSPGYSMFCMVSGALLNIILDPIFIFVLDMGIAGAAWATVISQGFSAAVAVLYFLKFRKMHLNMRSFAFKWDIIRATLALGAASCVNQVAITIVHIAMNNTLTLYGTGSVYGADIPLAVTGVISKVNVVFMAFTIGIAQGCQPIFGYNYGARQYERVRQTFRAALLAVTAVSTIAFLCFQLIPERVISIFGHGDPMYYRFGSRYLRIFMLLTFINGIHPLVANFLTSIGKAYKGIFVSLTRQLLLRLPLIIILPRFMGIEGVFFSGPIADMGAMIVAVALVTREFRLMKNMIPSPRNEMGD